jgi:hypothetical protein
MLCAFGSSGLGSLISSVERNWPWQLLVHHEANSAAGGVTPFAGVREGEDVSRSESDPDSASLRFNGSGQPPKDVET